MLYKMAVAAFILLSLPILASADVGFEIKTSRSLWDEIASLKIDQLRYSTPACPLGLFGKECPNATYFLYYECCGTLNTDCCFKFQDWIIIAFIFSIAALVLGVILRVLTFACRR